MDALDPTTARYTLVTSVAENNLQAQYRKHYKANLVILCFQPFSDMIYDNMISPAAIQ